MTNEGSERRGEVRKEHGRKTRLRKSAEKKEENLPNSIKFLSTSGSSVCTPSSPGGEEEKMLKKQGEKKKKKTDR